MPLRTGSFEVISTVSSALSLLSCGYIVVRYITRKRMRRHPAGLILMRTIFEAVFSIFVIIQSWAHQADFTADDTTDNGCAGYSFVAQYTLLGSELWFGLLSYDLLNTMQNPLANLKSLKKYHVFVNVTCFAFAISLIGAKGYGRSSFGMCWIRTGGNSDEALNRFMVVMFYVPIVIIYLFSLSVMFMAFVRLNKGLRHTIQTRRFIIERERNYVVTYFLFWTLAVILYGVAWLHDADRAYYWKSSNKVSLAFVFVFMAKSCVSAMLFWFHGGPSNADTKSMKLNAALRGEIILFVSVAVRGAVHQSSTRAHERTPLQSSGSQSGWADIPVDAIPLHIASGAAAMDMSSLRASQEVSTVSPLAPPGIVVTSGSGEGTSSGPDVMLFGGWSRQKSHLSDILEQVSTAQRNAASRRLSRPGTVSKFVSNFMSSWFGAANANQVLVRLQQLRPDVFASIRRTQGITDTDFLNALSETVSHQFSEGASGAFTCYSKDKRYLVKTMSSGDTAALEDIVMDYARHLESHPGSLLCKFYLCIKMTIYKQDVVFVVMENVFPPTAVIQERYDLKGSFVNRSARSTRPRHKRCKYCDRTGGEMANRYLDQRCPESPTNVHDFGVVLKDNDFQYKLNLSVDDSKQLRDALVLDSLFLRDHDIMDYSLLIGVRHQRLRLTREAVMTDLQRTPSSTMQDQKSSREDAPMFGHGLSSGEVFHKAAFGGMMPESWEPPVVFYLGVIDMLQRWDVSKRLERAAKLILCRDGDGLSAIEPHAYQKRFEEQVINVVTYVPTAASVHTPNAV